jgi:hypothetical protein
MDKGCNLNKDCPSAGLTAQSASEYNACTLKQQAPEPVDGCKLTRVHNRYHLRTWILTTLAGLKALPLGDLAVKA